VSTRVENYSLAAAVMTSRPYSLITSKEEKVPKEAKKLRYNKSTQCLADSDNSLAYLMGCVCLCDVRIL